MGMPKYDWPGIHKEFLQSDYLTVANFLRGKGMKLPSQSSLVAQKTRGWGKEKNMIRDGAATDAAAQSWRNEFSNTGEVRARQARLARFLQLKAMAKIKNTEPATFDEARKALATGLIQERDALGVGPKIENQSLTQVNINLPKTKFDKMIEEMDYEQIIKFIAELKKLKSRGTGGTLPVRIIQGVGEVKEPTS